MSFEAVLWRPDIFYAGGLDAELCPKGSKISAIGSGTRNFITGDYSSDERLRCGSQSTISVKMVPKRSSLPSDLVCGARSASTYSSQQYST